MMPTWDVERWLTDNDRIRSRTTHDLVGLFEAVQPLRNLSTRRLLDIGCGFGGLTKLVEKASEPSRYMGWTSTLKCSTRLARRVSRLCWSTPERLHFRTRTSTS